MKPNQILTFQVRKRKGEKTYYVLIYGIGKRGYEIVDEKSSSKKHAILCAQEFIMDHLKKIVPHQALDAGTGRPKPQADCVKISKI